jgi:hypothetical protein
LKDSDSTELADVLSAMACHFIMHSTQSRSRKRGALHQKGFGGRKDDEHEAPSAERQAPKCQAPNAERITFCRELACCFKMRIRMTCNAP